VRRPLAKRLASWVLLTIARTKWGLPVGLMPVIVDRLGPLGALRWMVKNLPRYERMLKELGAVRGNLISAFVSMLNGCYYCAFAHARAFELLYFKARRSLFPMDEHQMVDLIVLPDQEVIARLDAAFTAAQMPEATPLFRRLVELKYHGAAPSTAEDAYLAHAIQMFEVLNFCGISAAVPLDGAHDPINKDMELRARYAEARLASLAGQRLADPSAAVDAAAARASRED